MGWKLVKADSANTKVDQRPGFTNITKQSKAESISIPSWYTEEDRMAKAVMEGICKGCAHLLFLRENSLLYEFKGVWCAVLKKKLQVKVDGCTKFYELGDEIERLIKELGIGNKSNGK